MESDASLQEEHVCLDIVVVFCESIPCGAIDESWHANSQSSHENTGDMKGPRVTVQCVIVYFLIDY